MVSRPMVLRAGCGLVIGGLLVMAVRTGGWTLVIRATEHVGPAALALALTVTLISMTLSSVVWARVLRYLGYRASVRDGITIYGGTSLASYIGTGAGAVGGCVVLLRRRGVCAGRAALLMAIANVLAFCGSVVWAPTGIALLTRPKAMHALPALGAQAPIVAIVIASVCAAGALGILWLTTLTSRVGTRWRFARFAIDPTAPALQLRLRRLLALIPIAALSWLIGAVPLWVLVRAAAPGVPVSLSAVIAVQSVAALVAAITFFLPNGLGARDGITVVLLAGVVGVPLPAAAAAALLMRVSDPVGKALLLVTLAIMKRIPMRAPAPAQPWSALGGAIRSVYGRVVPGAPLPDTTA